MTKQRLQGIWVPTGWVATLAALVGMLVIGFKAVQGISQIQFQVGALTTAQQQTNHIMQQQIEQTRDIDLRLHIVETRQSDDERRLTNLEKH